MKNTKIILVICGIFILLMSNGITYYILNERNMEDIRIAWEKGEDNYRGFVISNFVGAGKYCEEVRIIYNPRYVKEIPTSEVIMHNDNRILGYFLDVEAENNDGDYMITFMNTKCLTDDQFLSTLNLTKMKGVGQ
jgi:hypothetical protein